MPLLSAQGALTPGCLSQLMAVFVTVAHLRGVVLRTVNSCARGEKHLADLIPAPPFYITVLVYGKVGIKSADLSSRTELN